MTRHTYKPVAVVAGHIVLRGDATAAQHPFAVIPRSCGYEANSYRLADTFDVEFDAARFPFHRDDIRSMSCEIHIFERESMADDITVMVDGHTPQVVGRVESPELEMGEDGRTFSLDGKDYTEALITVKWPPGKTVAVGGTLLDTVQGLVDEATDAKRRGRYLVCKYIEAEGEGMQARPFGFYENVPRVDAGGVPVLVKTKKAKGGKKVGPRVKAIGTKAKGLTWPEGLTMWDVIVDLCALSGKRVFVRGLEVIISAPADLVQPAEVTTAAQPARERAQSGGIFAALGKAPVELNQPGVYHMAYGRNITDLKISGHTAGERTPQQIVKCYDKVSRKTLIGKFPAVRGDTDPEANVLLTHNMDQAACDERAETIWHEIARGESTLEFETRDLTDLGELSLLEMRAGDSIRIDHDPLHRDELAKMSSSERFEYLIAAGFADGVARAVASNFDSLERWNRVYYVTNVSVDWDASSGVTIKVQAANYLGQRATEQLQPSSFDDGTVSDDDGTVSLDDGTVAA